MFLYLNGALICSIVGGAVIGGFEAQRRWLFFVHCIKELEPGLAPERRQPLEEAETRETAFINCLIFGFKKQATLEVE